MPILFYFYAVYALWLAVEVFINRGLRRSGSDAKGKDRRSTAVIWTAVGVLIPLAVIGCFYLPGSLPPFVAGIGLAVLIAGLVLRVAAVVTLGRYFTGTLTIRQDHRLKTDGLYKRVRHPSYTGLLLCIWGFALSWAHWLPLVLVGLPLTALVLRRIAIEEAMLEAAFGDVYRAYRTRSWKLVPLVY